MVNRFLFTLAVILLCAGCAAQSTVVTDERMAPGEMTDPSQLLVRLWQKPGMFKQAYDARLMGGRLYVTGDPRGMETINITTGLTDWVHVGKLPADFAPVVWQEMIYLVEGGQIVLLDEATGLEKGRYRTKIGMMTPVYPGESIWMTASPDERISGFLVKSGIRVYRATLDGFPVSSAWNDQDLAYFLTNSGTIFSVSIPTQAVTWRFELPKKDCSPITYNNEVIYVGNLDYRLYAIDAISGKLEWSKLLGAPVLTSAPVVTRDRVYAATTDGLVHAIDLATQEVAWSVPAYQMLTSTDKHVILQRIVDGDNFIIVVDARNGNVLSEITALPFSMFKADPDSGIFYVIDARGGVLAMADREVAEAARAIEMELR